MHADEKKDIIPHLPRRSDVNAKKDGETPLHLSAQDGHIALIDAGARERQETPSPER